MKYITQVGHTHVIEYSGKTHSIIQAPIQYSSDKDEKFQIGKVTVNKDLTIYGCNGSPHLAEIVLAVEITRFIMEKR